MGASQEGLVSSPAVSQGLRPETLAEPDPRLSSVQSGARAQVGALGWLLHPQTPSRRGHLKCMGAQALRRVKWGPAARKGIVPDQHFCSM